MPFLHHNCHQPNSYLTLTLILSKPSIYTPSPTIMPQPICTPHHPHTLFLSSPIHPNPKPTYFLIHTYMHRYTNTHMYKYSCLHTYIQTHMHMHNFNTHTDTYMEKVHAYIHAFMHPSMHANMDIYLHIHTYICHKGVFSGQ